MTVTEPDPHTIIAGRAGAPNLAIDVQPTVFEGTFTLDESLLDSYDLLAWADEGWANIVCDVTRVHVARGATAAQSPVWKTEAGVATIEVIDTDRRFDPMVNINAIRTGTPLRVRAWGGTDPAAPDWSVVLFTAELDDLPVTYDRLGPPRVTLNASDVVSELARYAGPGYPEPGLGAGDDLRARVYRWLDEMQLGPEVLDPDVDLEYAARLNPTTLRADAWENITAAAVAELGRVWVNVHNRLVVRSRDSQLTGPIRGTLSDWHGETVEDGGAADVHSCYADPFTAGLGPEHIINRAIAGRRRLEGETGDEVVVQVDDHDSQVQHRIRVGEGDQQALELSTDGQLRPWAERLVLSSSWPELRVDSIAPAPWGAGPEAWRAVLETDIGDRWHLRHHPHAPGGMIARTMGVLGIEHEITPESWVITWSTVDATAGRWFILDEHEVDGPELLAPFAGAPAIEVA